MEKWRIVTGLAAVLSLLVGASAASAGPPEGPDIEGMSFLVTVANVDGFPGAPETFTNCYGFNDDGEWIDPSLPPGTWTPATNGPLTHYVATAGPLTQVGFVTPALTLHGKSVLAIPGGPLEGEYRFVSNGHAANC